MTIEERVQTIINEMDTAPLLLWGTMFENNLVLDTITDSGNDAFPCILMLPPMVEGNVRQFNVLNNYVVTLLFIDKIDVHEEQNITGKGKIQSMRSLAFEFLGEAMKYVHNLNQKEAISDYLLHAPNPNDKLNPEEFFNQLDINVAGYGLTVGIPISEKIHSC